MDVKGTLLSSIEEILDKMAFMYFDEEAEPAADVDDFPFITQVTVDGVIRGTLNVLVSEAAARTIARNLIGIREEDALHEGTLEDALQEFTNLLMGRTMTMLNPAGPFDMEIPTLVRHLAPADNGQTVLSICGALDDEPIQIILQYQEVPA